MEVFFSGSDAGHMQQLMHTVAINKYSTSILQQ